MPSRDQNPKAVQARQDLLAWLMPLLDHLQRTRRFNLGERLETGLMPDAGRGRSTSGPGGTSVATAPRRSSWRGPGGTTPW